MIEHIADYLLKNYYINSECPSRDMLIEAITNHIDKVIVLSKADGIVGIGIYLTLSDYIYENISKIDLTNVDVLTRMLAEKGKNIHFILVSTNGFGNIRAGLRDVVKQTKPKSVSWYDMYGQLHKYSMRG